MKRTLQLMLGFCLALTVLLGACTGVSAATAESVWVNGVQMIDGDYLAANLSPTVTPGAAAEPANYVAWYHNGTLTLNNADLHVGSPFAVSGNSGSCAICADGDVSIVLCGENRISKETGDFMAGIAVNGALGIFSTEAGSLDVTGTCFGLYSYGNSISISGDSIVHAVCNPKSGVIPDGMKSGGIFAEEGDIFITGNASVSAAYGETYEAGLSALLCAYEGNVTISGFSTFTVDETGVPFDSFGIYTGSTASADSGNLLISDGADVCMEGVCLGVSAHQSIVIGKDSSLGIYGALIGILDTQSIAIAGGTLEVSGQSVGVTPNLTLTGTSLTAASYRGQLYYNPIEISDLSKISYDAQTRRLIYDNNPEMFLMHLLICPSHEYAYESYSDCETWNWAAPYAGFVIENGIMGSVYSGSKYFDSNGTVTRGMVVTVMYRLAGSPTLTEGDYAAYNGKFGDVAKGQWYYDAVVWANKNGVTTGMTETSFVPNGKVTREQLVTFFYRFSKTVGGNLMGGATLTRFQDKNQIADYAFEAFQWAFEMGIVSGTTSTTLSPKDYCTRGQMAKIVTVFARSLITGHDWVIPDGLQ